jgi:hypothetical protein
LVFKSRSLWIRHPIIYLTVGCAFATRHLVSFLGYILALVKTHQLYYVLISAFARLEYCHVETEYYTVTLTILGRFPFEINLIGINLE